MRDAERREVELGGDWERRLALATQEKQLLQEKLKATEQLRGEERNASERLVAQLEQGTVWDGVLGLLGL